MNKPTLDMDAEIKSHYEPNSEDDEAWRHGLDDLSGCGHDFIDALIAEREEMKKKLNMITKFIDDHINDDFGIVELSNLLEDMNEKSNSTR